MINEEYSIVINRPIEEVFAYVSDLRHSAVWQKGLLEVRKETEGPLGVGTRFSFVRDFLGRKLESSNEFVKFNPPTLVVFDIPSGPVPGQASYRFEHASNGTALTSTVRMETKGFSRLAEPLVTVSLRKDMKANLATLKKLLESKQAGTAQ
jgi:uncharacterized protein YndB with AHSA1/START domain